MYALLGRTGMSLLGRVSGGMFGMCWFGCNGCMHLQGCLYWDVLVVFGMCWFGCNVGYMDVLGC